MPVYNENLHNRQNFLALCEKIDLNQVQVSENQEELIDDYGEDFFSAQVFIKDTNLAGTIGGIKLVFPSTIESFDPKTLAILAQLFVSQNEILQKIKNTIEILPKNFVFSGKLIITGTNGLQFITLLPQTVFFIKSFFIKKKVMKRRRKAYFSPGLVHIRRSRFVTLSELFSLFLLSKPDASNFNHFILKNWSSFLSIIKQNRLYLVNV